MKVKVKLTQPGAEIERGQVRQHSRDTKAGVGVGGGLSRQKRNLRKKGFCSEK